MSREELSRRDFHRLASMLILGAVLTACTPEGQAQETRPAATQTIEDYDPSEEITIDAGVETELASATPTASATVENTPTMTATATPENTATPEFTATPEEMTQAEIRAEILAAGVNLDDLANSKDEWTSSHKAIDSIQDSIDNLNFGKENAGYVTTVVIGLETVENLEEIDQALTTDGGWKLTSFAKLAYKQANGDWQIIKVPLSAYHVENDLVWMKDVGARSAPYFMEREKIIKPDENGVLKIQLTRIWEISSEMSNYHYGTGSFIKLDTGWVENPEYANHSDALLGEPPRYSEQELIEFRKTGDPSIFGYKDRDGYYIFWPIVTFHANLSDLSSYDHE